MVTPKKEKKEKEPAKQGKIPATAEKKKKIVPKATEYFEAVGRRKNAIARARISENNGAKGTIEVNNKDFKHFFTIPELVNIVESPLVKTAVKNNFFVSLKITGGGINGWADAARHAISRALIKYNPEFRKTLKQLGFLKRDPRAKERRKFGLKKARKAPQWSKR
jgi:small subunit ribosomal protein S9